MILFYLRLAFRTFFKEPVLVVPYAAYYSVLNILIVKYFSTSTIEKLLKTDPSKLFIVLGFFTIVESFVLGLTLAGIRQVIEAKDVDKKHFFSHAFFASLHTFFGTMALIPILIVLVVTIKPLLGMSMAFRLVGLGVGGAIGAILLLFKFLFPAVIVVENTGWIGAFVKTGQLLKMHFQITISVALGVFSFWMLMLIIAEIVSAIPVVGLSVFNVAVQAVSAVVAAGVSLFYYAFVTKSSLKIIWHNQESDEEGKSNL